MTTVDPTTDLRSEFMFVADGAHAVGGKLYVLGGAWTHLWLPVFPGRAPIPFSVAVGISIPWSMTNRRFSFEATVVTSDGVEIDKPAFGDFEQGRPPGLRPGTPQRFTLAFPVGTVFPEPGRYSFVVKVDGEEVGRTSIEVQQQNQQQQMSGMQQPLT